MASKPQDSPSQADSSPSADGKKEVLNLFEKQELRATRKAVSKSGDAEEASVFTHLGSKQVALPKRAAEPAEPEPEPEAAEAEAEAAPAEEEPAVIEADGTLVPTKGECKEGADFNYKGEWGYHVLLVSLANTQEPLLLDNRSGNRPSSEGAAARFDQALALCRRAGFRRVTFRGDTDFSQTLHLDRWDEDWVRFVFGFDAHPTLVERAESLKKSRTVRIYDRHTSRAILRGLAVRG